MLAYPTRESFHIVCELVEFVPYLYSVFQGTSLATCCKSRKGDQGRFCKSVRDPPRTLDRLPNGPQPRDLQASGELPV